jgi:hypothetical protein
MRSTFWAAWRRVSVLAACAALASCGGGGGGGGGSDSPAQPLDLTVVVVSHLGAGGYAAGATLCIDDNADLQCQAGESFGTTDATGQFRSTLDATQQTRLDRARLLARYTTDLVDRDTGQTVSGEVVQLAAPHTPGAARIVLSPLVTWSEQLVLATMARADARAAVREQAQLQAIAVDDDFVGGVPTAGNAERLRADDAARNALSDQTPAVMQVLAAPSTAYTDTLTTVGTWRVALLDSFSLPGALDGQLRGTAIDTIDPAIGPQFGTVVWRLDAQSGYQQQPQVILNDATLAGPVLEADGSWSTSNLDPTREVLAGRVFSKVTGVRRDVEMRSGRSVAGQAIDATAFGGVAPPPGALGGAFPAGSLRFDTIVFAGLSSYGITSPPVERRDAAGQVIPGQPGFASFADFVAHYQEGANWYELSPFTGEQLAFTADGRARYRIVESSGAVTDLGVAAVSVVDFNTRAIHRVEVAGALQPFYGAALDFVAANGVLRPITLQRRGVFGSGSARVFNPTAARALVDALTWGEPPGGL